MDDPWGRDTPPALTGEPPPLPPRLAELAALTGPRELAPGEHFTFPSADELPEVAALAADGWRPLEPAAAFGGLPAMWPAEHRCWVPDRLPKITESFCLGGPLRIRPQAADEWAWSAELRTTQLADCGLPAEPPGRIWLLRSPWPSLGVEVVLSILSNRAEETLGNPGPVEITRVAREVMTWTEEQVWDSWHGPRAEAARQWRRRGRVGEDAAAVVLRGLMPDHLATLADPAGAALSEPQALAWCDAVLEVGDEAVHRVQGWRGVGLPPDPPPQMHRLMETAPAEAAAWLEAGFTLGELVALLGVPLEQALTWRGAGFEAAETRRLLDADPTLTPAEARAFTEAGFGEDQRVGWAEAGFSATEARAWTELDILAQEARAWRSMGKGPADAARHRADGGGALPPDLQVGWTASGEGREHRKYGVKDPPGTRGCIARDQSRRRRGRYY